LLFSLAGGFQQGLPQFLNFRYLAHILRDFNFSETPFSQFFRGSGQVLQDVEMFVGVINIHHQPNDQASYQDQENQGGNKNQIDLPSRTDRALAN
jgi:hypothetical protein